MVVSGAAIWVILFVVAGVLLAAGLLLLILAPLLSSRLATSTSRPKLERRASGPDRMRQVINSQISARRKRSTFATTLTRSGVILMGAAAIALVAGGVLALTGAGS